MLYEFFIGKFSSIRILYNCRKCVIAMLKYTNERNNSEFSIILNKKIKNSTLKYKYIKNKYKTSKKRIKINI
ncbi:hypothetical protein CF091_13150 [Clostridium botulinum]